MRSANGTIGTNSESEVDVVKSYFFLTLTLLASPVWTQTTAPDFLFEPNGGQVTSVTVNAGQGADFSLVLVPVNGFVGTVNLNCAITPVVKPAPTCILSPLSVQLIAPTAQQVAVTMSTTGPRNASAMPHFVFPLGRFLWGSRSSRWVWDGSC